MRRESDCKADAGTYCYVPVDLVRADNTVALPCRAALD